MSKTIMNMEQQKDSAMLKLREIGQECKQGLRNTRPATEQAKLFCDFLKDLVEVCTSGESRELENRYPIREYLDRNTAKKSTEVLKNMIQFLRNADTSVMNEVMKEENCVFESIESVLRYLFTFLKTFSEELQQVHKKEEKNLQENSSNSCMGKKTQKRLGKVTRFVRGLINKNGEKQMSRKGQQQITREHARTSEQGHEAKFVVLVDAQRSLLHSTQPINAPILKVEELQGGSSPTFHNDLHLLVILLKTILSHKVLSFNTSSIAWRLLE